MLARRIGNQNTRDNVVREGFYSLEGQRGGGGGKNCIYNHHFTHPIPTVTCMQVVLVLGPTGVEV